ncbi:hypothetical protein [uncultured Clostridium sp.]|jgi:hypothetical protein|uniref:hypothetical protein n=1 Tax=Clostridium sp. TaxID=1506 RepID=UPI0025E4A4D1|nr:hypothetical protein [uncultured Clostridium sp.]
MIKIKIDKNRSNEPIFKLGFKELDEKENRFLKRALMDGKEIKGMYKYEIPLKYLLPIIKNLNKNNIKLDRYSKLAYLEFSDDFDENYYYILEANAKFMRKWREEGCPNIFKVEIDRETLDVKKEIIFKKIDRIYA